MPYFVAAPYRRGQSAPAYPHEMDTLLGYFQTRMTHYCGSARRKMAGPTGFEPATSRLTIWRPNQAERRPREVCLRWWIGNDNSRYTIIGHSPERYLRQLDLRGDLILLRASNHFDGRRNRDRTCDLCLVRAALSQLSYPPDFLSSTGGGYQVLSCLVNRFSQAPFCASPRSTRTPLLIEVMHATASGETVLGNIADGRP